MKYWGGSTQGPSRGENQDSFGADTAAGLFVVSDGMGGHEGGAQASRQVVDSLLEAGDGGPDATRAQSDELLLKSRVRRAHRRTVRLARDGGHEGNMGATLVCLWLHAGRYLMAVVGDSRGYMLRGGRLMQISEDHTLVNSYVREGIISPEEARSHPQRNVLIQAMGMGEVEPDVFAGPAEPGDRFLLCSDGVHDVLEDRDLRNLLGKAPDPETAGRAILRLAEERGGTDDATVMTVFI